VQQYMATEASIGDLNTVKYALKPDRTHALKRYLRSAKNGDSEACNCAGLMLEKINPIEAVDCYRQALELDPGNTDAMLNLALLYYTTKDEREWHEIALQLVQRASDLGNEKAFAYLDSRGLLGVYSAEGSLPTPTPTILLGTMMATHQPPKVDKRLANSVKRDATLKWDLTRTQMEPEIREDIDETVSYALTQTNNGGFDFSRKDS